MLGIDLGINVPLYGAINDKKDRIALGDRDSFLNQRLKFQKRKRQLQRDLKLTKGGKGRGKKLKALESLSTKERNFAKNTSQRCNNCGYIDKESRKSQSEFECTSCGHEESADYNAAKNISMAHTKEFQKEIEKHASSLKLCEA